MTNRNLRRCWFNVYTSSSRNGCWTTILSESRGLFPEVDTETETRVQSCRQRIHS